MTKTVDYQLITSWDASELSAAIHARRVSCREVMQAYLSAIAEKNPASNALVALRSETDCLAMADQADRQLDAGHSNGWLHGIPQAIKDLAPVAGMLSTSGSPLLKDNIPAQDGLMVSRMRAAGAIFIGRSNVPEFGLGSHSFNSVYGVTRNPYDHSRSAGGSSGGAAAALALRILPVADGSDFMGSLRNPAGWNNVLGMRPSQGRVPYWPTGDVWIAQMGTEGPMGRSVRDLAQLLAIQSGPDARSPLCMTERFSLEQALNPLMANSIRVAWLGDLGGYLPMEEGIADTCSSSLASWEKSGIRLDDKSTEVAVFGVENASLWKTWLAWRSALVGQRLEPMMSLAPNAREQIKPEALWEYDQSLGMGVSQFAKASAMRSTFFANCAALFEKYDVLALPSAQAWPFAVEERWPATIAGRSMDTYHRWMEATIYATLLGAPAVCMPAGFDKKTRLPMGMQFIGRPGADALVLQIAAHYEAWMREHESQWYLRQP